MSRFQISFMEKSQILRAAQVLSIAMLNNPLHQKVFLGNGEPQRIEIEQMFVRLFTDLPGIVFLAKENDKIIGVMRMHSCMGRKAPAPEIPGDKTDIAWRKSLWQKAWADHDPVEQHWHLGPITQS